MTVDRDKWAEQFTDALPNWRCPACLEGHFSVKTEDLVIEETGPSKAAHDHDAWEPDWIENRFIGLLSCSNANCGELAAVCGSSSVNYYQVDWDEYVDEKTFNVAAISPAPIPIDVPTNAPEAVVGAIDKASSLIWMNSEAAANQIRQAVEAMMDDAGIDKLDSKEKPIFLHKRIVEFSKSDPDNGKVLLATKWLGNSGSHIGGIDRDDVLDAFEMLEFVLENRYDTKKKELLAKVDAVNAAKGPAKPAP